MFKQGKARAYGHVKKEVRHGIKFDSPWEADRYDELLLLQVQGKVRNIEPHPSYSFVHPETKIRIGGYRPDFRYEERVQDLLGDRWETIVEDVKGYQSAQEKDYRLRLQMMRAFFRIEVRETGYDAEKAKKNKRAKEQKKRIAKRMEQAVVGVTPCSFACSYLACKEERNRCVLKAGHDDKTHLCGFHFAERLRRQGAARR